MHIVSLIVVQWPKLRVHVTFHVNRVGSYNA